MPLDIKQNPDYHKHADKCGSEYPCVVCGRGIPKPVHYVHLYYGSMAVTEEEAAEFARKDGDGGGDLGHYPVGSDCLKRHPEIRPYLVRR